MFVDSLENIAKRRVCSNLYVTYRLCTECYLRKLPTEVSQSIFDEALLFINNFNINHLRFFNGHIAPLRCIDLTIKQFSLVENYDFLDGHKFETMVIGRCKNFKTNKRIKFTVQNLIIRIKRFTDIDKNMSNFMLCLTVRNSVKIISDRQHVYSTTISTLFERCLDSVTEIDINCLLMTTKQFRIVHTLLHKITYLENFSVRLITSPNSQDIDNRTLTTLFYNMPKRLISLVLSSPSSELNIYSRLPVLIEKLVNLQSLTLETLPSNDKIVANILGAIRDHRSSKLESLHLKFRRVSYIVRNILEDTLRTCSCLKYIKLECQDLAVNCLDSGIIDSLRCSSRSLNEFHIGIIQNISLKNSLEALLNECHSLTLINMGFVLEFMVDIASINTALTTSRTKLKAISFEDINFQENVAKELKLYTLNNIRTLEFVNVEFQSYSLKTVFMSLRYIKESLADIKIINCNLKNRDIPEIAIFLDCCENLDSAEFCENIKLREGIVLLLQSMSNNTSLKSLAISGCGINDNHAESILKAMVFENFKHLRKFICEENLISGLVAFKLLKNLAKCCKVTEISFERCCFHPELLKFIQLFSETIPSLQTFQNGISS